MTIFRSLSTSSPAVTRCFLFDVHLQRNKRQWYPESEIIIDSIIISAKLRIDEIQFCCSTFDLESYPLMPMTVSTKLDSQNCIFCFVWYHWIKLLVLQCKSKISWSLAGVWHICGVTVWWHIQLSRNNSYLKAMFFLIYWAVKLALDFDPNWHPILTKPAELMELESRAIELMHWSLEVIGLWDKVRNGYVSQTPPVLSLLYSIIIPLCLIWYIIPYHTMLI